MTLRLHYAARTNIGLVRKNNEDSGYASPNLIAVADGMGGAAAGDVASAVAIAHLQQTDGVYPAEELLPKLRRTIREAHWDLVRRVEENPKLRGMGTTCIALLRAGDRLGMVHIGDSRAYLLRNNRLMQITRDHTYVQYLVDRGQITPEEARTHPERNKILYALDANPMDVEFDESMREALPADRWLLCSDGLFGVVSDETLANVLVSVRDLDACAERLIELALAAGAPDNVTVILADVVDEGDAPAENGKDAARGKYEQPVIVGAAADYRFDLTQTSPGGRNAPAEHLPPSVPAGQQPEGGGKEEKESARKKRKRRGLQALFTLVAAAVLCACLEGGYAWSQRQYFVAPYRGKVALYQGVSQNIGPLRLHRCVKVTSVKVADLPVFVQHRLKSGISKSSEKEAKEALRNILSYGKNKSGTLSGTDKQKAETPSETGK